MPVEFRAVSDPSRDLMERVSALAPENPFFTFEYVDARRTRGVDAYVIYLEEDARLFSACTAFSTRGRLNHRLEITSLPHIDDPAAFWEGLRRFCTESNVSILDVHTFASEEAEIPHNEGEVSRKVRYEFQLDLKNTDLWRGLHRRHQRHIKKALNAGLTLTRSIDPQACEVHTRLANIALTRRRDRGHEIASEIQDQDSLAYLQSNVGEIFQAVLDGEVLSSILVLKSSKGAYAQTSGTTSGGRDLGASQLLFYETACILQKESFDVFNLGGTDMESTGLQDFKASFGARRLQLEAVEFHFGGVVKKTIGKLIEKFRA